MTAVADVHVLSKAEFARLEFSLKTCAPFNHRTSSSADKTQKIITIAVTIVRRIATSLLRMVRGPSWRQGSRVELAAVDSFGDDVG